MMKLRNPLMGKKLKGLVQADNSYSIAFSYTAAIIANVCVALSGCILYADKVFLFLNISFPVQSKWADVGMDFETYVWFVSQTISPILLMLGGVLRAKILVYIIPIYCYILQLYWIFIDYKITDNSYLQAYVIGTSFLVFLVIYGIRYLLKKRLENKINNIRQTLN